MAIYSVPVYVAVEAKDSREAFLKTADYIAARINYETIGDPRPEHKLVTADDCVNLIR